MTISDDEILEQAELTCDSAGKVIRVIQPAR
jgi:hypothetical protein